MVVSQTPQLAPALGEAFIIIALGYVMTVTGVITPESGSHIAKFIAYVALPALLFRSIALLDFGDIDPRFFLGIFVAKAALFVLTAVVNLVINWRRRSVWAVAGIQAIFSQASNDLALGIPIVNAVFGMTHPTFINYQYLLQVIGLLFLNPIGFVMVEYGVRHRAAGDQGSIILRVVKRVVTNPIVFMVFLGLVWNRSIGPTIPWTIDLALQLAGNAFDACALFCLGASMVGLTSALKMNNVMTPTSLTILKVIIAPIVHKYCVSAFGIEGPLTVYAFIYGALPTAPVVFVWAKLFRVNAKILAASVVLCTIVSAPVMLVSARMASFNFGSSAVQSQMLTVLWSTSVDAGWLTVACAAWVLFFSAFLPKSTIMINLVRILCLAELMFAVTSVVCPRSSWVYSQEIRFFVMYAGVIAARTSVAVLVCTRHFIAKQGEKAIHKYRWWIYLCPLIVGSVVAIIAILSGTSGLWRTSSGECVGSYGVSEEISSAISLFLITIVTCMGLMRVLRSKHTAGVSLGKEKTVNILTDARRRSFGSDSASQSSDRRSLRSGGSRRRVFRDGGAGTSGRRTKSAGGSSEGSGVVELLSSRPIGSDVPGGGYASDLSSHSSDSEPDYNEEADVEAGMSYDSRRARVTSPPSVASRQPWTGAVRPGGMEGSPGLAAKEVAPTGPMSAGSASRRRTTAPSVGAAKGPSGPVLPTGPASNGSILDAVRREVSRADLVLSPGHGGRFRTRSRAGLSTDLKVGPSSLTQPLMAGPERGGGSTSSAARMQARAKGLHPDDQLPIFMHPKLSITNLRVLMLGVFHALSMSIAVVMLVIKLVRSGEEDAVTYEISFLDASLNHGQGLITLLVFGLADDLARPIYAMGRSMRRFFRRVMFGAEHVGLVGHLSGHDDAHMDGLEYLSYSAVLEQCQRFAPYLTICAVAIARDRRYRFSTYEKVFYGADLINWLLDEHLVSSRSDGLKFGRQLMYGGVVEHVKKEHNFYDDDKRFFYRFSPSVLAIEDDRGTSTSGESSAARVLAGLASRPLTPTAESASHGSGSGDGEE